MTRATVLGGLHLTANAPQTFSRANGRLISVIGTEVAQHPPASPPHKAPSQGGSCLTLTGASFARINGIPICRDDDLATCGHPNANGEAFARIGSGGGGSGGNDWGFVSVPPTSTFDYSGITVPVDTTLDWGTV